jgi:hypothetical protein
MHPACVPGQTFLLPPSVASRRISFRPLVWTVKKPNASLAPILSFGSVILAMTRVFTIHRIARPMYDAA